jgi:NADPH2:quinone reductase
VSRIIRLHRYGGPEELVTEEVEIPSPAADEIRVRQQAVGLNFVDIYHRTGLYRLPQLPAVLGVEGAGIIEEIGSNVSGFAVGDRVAYAGPPVGAYAEARLLPAARLIKLPSSIASETAAGAMLRGVTAHMLLTRVCPVSRGSTILIHAAAGGLGLVLVQWARRLGATTIGTVGSEAKAALAQEHGLDHAILYKSEDFVARALALTGNKGVNVAIDGVGAETLVKTLDCVQPFGAVVSVGQASGSLPSLPVDSLGPGRSLALVRPGIFRYVADLATYQKAATAVVGMLEAGLKIDTSHRFALADAATAHRALEVGMTSGSPLLIP